MEEEIQLAAYHTCNADPTTPRSLGVLTEFFLYGQSPGEPHPIPSDHSLPKKGKDPHDEFSQLIGCYLRGFLFCFFFFFPASGSSQSNQALNK